MAGRILIADNVATNRIILKVKLASASYEISQADCAATLLQAARDTKPDLILMDAALPDLDSFETCRKLKKYPETSAVPVVMMSNENNREIRLAALRAGAEDVLLKPLEEQALLARVRNLLRAQGLQEELLRRQGTAAGFGFHEAQTDFADKARVLLITPDTSSTRNWKTDIRNLISADITAVNQRHVLEEIGRQKMNPDVIVLPADLDQEKDCLTLIAELRSCAETRHSAIIVIRGSNRENNSIAALDIGANDLLEIDSLPKKLR